MPEGNVTTVRTQLIAAWKAKGKDYLLQTRPYKSADALIGKIVEAHAGEAGADQFVCAVFERGSELSFFSSGLQDTHPFYGRLTAADTNQVDGYRTNGGEDYIIEGMSAHCRSVRLTHPAAYRNGYTDSRIREILQGGIVCDPGCLIQPPQVASPLNLEQAIYETIAPHLSVHIEFNRERMEYVGDLGQFPEGNGRSFLRSHGVPETGNRYRIPEGYRWIGSDGPDSQLRVVARLERDVLVPLSTVKTPGIEGVNVPESIALDICFKLHGGALRNPSKN